MKKAISILLALCLTCAFGATVSAATQSTPVTAEVTFTYTVEIPASITLTFNNTSAVQYSITATDVSLPSNTQVVVTAEGSGAGKAFSITNSTNNVPFALSLSNPGADLNPGDEIATFKSSSSSPFWIRVPDWSAAQTAGTYTGSITFTMDTEIIPVKPTLAVGAYHTVALKSDGTVWAWGANGNGQLGDNTLIDKHTPVQVLTNVTDIAAGRTHTIALRLDGTVWTWGGNGRGQLGNGTTVENHIPTQVDGISDVIAVTAGDDFTAVLKSDGTVWTWGRNMNGTLGIGSLTDSSYIPVQVKDLTDIQQVKAFTDVVAISSGGHNSNHTLALKSDGTVWAWGFGSSGQLGDGGATNRLSPVQVTGLTDVTAIAAGAVHSMALKHDGTVWAWGLNGEGQLAQAIGDTTNRHTPETMSINGTTMTGVIAIEAGGANSVAIRAGGVVFTCGANDSGQLGNGTNTPFSYPARVVGVGGIDYLSDVTVVAASVGFMVALQSDGTIVAWGLNTNGQLGDGTTTQRLTPVQVIFP